MTIRLFKLLYTIVNNPQEIQDLAFSNRHLLRVYTVTCWDKAPKVGVF